MKAVKTLHVLFEHGVDQQPYGCSMVRLLRPLQYPGLALPWTLTTGVDLPATAPDTVVVERLWRPGTDVVVAQALAQRLRHDRSRLIYTLDDNLLELGWPARRANAVLLLARQADRVIVSTEALAQRLRHLNRDVVVLPNQIDDTLFGPPRAPQAPGETVTLGYMGTPTHLHDLLHILAPLRRVLRRHADRVRLELVGVADSPHVRDLFPGLPVSLKPATGHVAYDRFVPWMKRELHWDLALAPLTDTPFNRCKSDLKFLDYAALSIPGIFSAVTPYTATVQHDQTGLLAADAAQWEAQLEYLIGDHAARTRLALAARDAVYATRSLKQHAPDWVAALQESAPAAAEPDPA